MVSYLYPWLWLNSADGCWYPEPCTFPLPDLVCTVSACKIIFVLKERALLAVHLQSN